MPSFGGKGDVEDSVRLDGTPALGRCSGASIS